MVYTGVVVGNQVCLLTLSKSCPQFVPPNSLTNLTQFNRV